MPQYFRDLCITSSALLAFWLWQKRQQACRKNNDQPKKMSPQNSGHQKHYKSIPEVYELKGKFYQVLGHAWCHQAKDFKIVYRPLYHCIAKNGKYEAHTLAVSHFSRWEEKFKRVNYEDLPPDILPLVLQGPFWHDPEWIFHANSSPVPCTISKMGTRSHDSSELIHILGDYHRFISGITSKLLDAGLDVLSQGYEMDHICYRCETTEEYKQVCQKLTARFGKLLIESIIGGRPISVIQLHKPIRHCGFSVSCIEVPSPKTGRFYASGLEHAEFVVGQLADTVLGNKCLVRFMEWCQEQNIRLTFDLRAFKKKINADVSVRFKDDFFGTMQAKFHHRPLNEVVAYEIQHNQGLNKTPP